MTGAILVIQETKKKGLVCVCVCVVCEDIGKELNESINIIYC